MTVLKSIFTEFGEWSYKRVIGVLGFLLLGIAFLATTFSNNAKTPPDNLTSAIEWITIACLFGTVAEKFRPKDLINLKTKNSDEKNT